MYSSVLLFHIFFNFKTCRAYDSSIESRDIYDYLELGQNSAQLITVK